ncbi:MAG: hypothetical protein AAFN12_16375 [Cyanobacteria bacterium J06560_2]
MRRLLLILLATAPLTGCQFLSAGEDVAIIDPFEGAGEIAAEAGEDITQALSGDDIEEAIVAEAVVLPPTVTADLISSTDPEARTRQVLQSRIDPFAVLPIPLAPKPVEIPAAGNNARSGGASGGGNGSSAAATAAAAKPSTPTPPAVQVRAVSQPVVRPSPIVALPRIPQPVIAPTIAISGIIQLGGEPYAIVNAGSEPERYVRVGDRLAGGSVRVKRIDTMAFEPQVILEENGIEVSRPVGNGGASTENSSPGGNAAPAEGPAEAPIVPVASLPPLPSVVAPRQAPSAVSAPVIPTSAPANSSLPAPGFVPSSLLLQPPEITSQVTLPNMQIEVPESV